MAHVGRKRKTSSSTKRAPAPSSIIERHRVEAAADLRVRGASCLRDGGGPGCQRLVAAADLLDPTDPPEKTKALEQEKIEAEPVREAERDDNQSDDPADEPGDPRDANVVDDDE